MSSAVSWPVCLSINLSQISLCHQELAVSRKVHASQLAVQTINQAWELGSQACSSYVKHCSLHSNSGWLGLGQCENESVVCKNSHFVTKVVNCFLLNGGQLTGDTLARVLFAANISSNRVFTVGALSDLASSKNGYFLE